MRVLLVLAAALALAGCQVDVEGAACVDPGSSDLCPSGQRCGNDLRCSARAAGCAHRCTAGERGCVDGDVQVCVDSDPVCGTWSMDVDCEAGLECRGTGAEAACFCPANGGAEVVVDAAAGAPSAAPAPTGVRTPATCRFGTIEAGLAAARDGVSVVVVAAGAAATYPVTSPLAIPPGVTLRGDDDPPAPERRVLSLEGDLAHGVTLAEGATLSGFTVRNGSAAATADGVKVACAAGGAARLEDVVVEAAGTARLAQGVVVEGACPVELARVTVGGAAGTGLLVTREAADQTVVAADSTFDGNGEGVRLTRGDLTLQRALVKASAGVGVVAAGGVDARLTLDQCTVRGNGDTGITVATATARLHLLRSRICGNAAAADRGSPYATRRVGGIYLFGNPPADLAFLGNAVHGNAGDQVLVASAASWNLDGPPACGAGTNAFGAYAAGYVGVFAGSVAPASPRVSALWNAWQGSAAPALGVDYAISGTASVDAGQTYDPARFCPAVDPLVCD